MKIAQYISVFFFLQVFFQHAYATSIDFTCFQYKWEILNPPKNETIQVVTNHLTHYFFQEGKPLQSKIYKTEEPIYFPFYVHGKEYTQYSHVFDQYDTKKELVIHFPKTLLKGTFFYTLQTNNPYVSFQISNNGKEWYKIQDSLENYDLDYVKIIFSSESWEKNILKNTEIFELSFYQKTLHTILVKSVSFAPIEIYSHYVCEENEVNILFQKQKKSPYFPITKHTKIFTGYLFPNKDFNPNHITKILYKDTDQDGVPDKDDNCKYDYNPNQLDSTASWVGDVCSDVDNDTIIGKNDNCPLLYNPDQKDENKNGIGDVCERDTDKDGFVDADDTCPHTSDPEQYDTDEDHVWDACDNCKNVYNPDQKDIDWDMIGDACDEKDDRFIESNKTFFIIFIIILGTLFIIFILLLIGKIQKHASSRIEYDEDSDNSSDSDSSNGNWGNGGD